jgi:ADP-ribosylglycohydrolase
MRAWERNRVLTDEAIPKVLTEEEQTWDFAEQLEQGEDMHAKILWFSHVPGSYAPESIMTAAVQSMENMGYVVDDAETLLDKGMEALGKYDMVSLHEISAVLWNRINNAKQNQNSAYTQYKNYQTFDDYASEVEFIKKPYTAPPEKLRDQIYAGWLSQIIGGAMGTAIEGYTTANILKAFGNVSDYIRKPNTYNDDITYELAFLKAYEEKGRLITAGDIAQKWVGLIPMGWSAEEIALRNIRYGIFPPQSGYFCNPFREWIGAQMRGAICGMVAPGDTKEAARLAWLDGCVSHANNGILGEVFNAIIVSLSFVETDIRKILHAALSMMPKKSEYHHVVDFAYLQARKNNRWEAAWHACEDYLKEYNWIHAYPNAAAEVVALYYGEGDFDKTMHIIAMAGQDVDCNATQIMTAIGIIIGSQQIPLKWREPIGNKLDTYVRTMKKMTITSLTDWTYRCIKLD